MVILGDAYILISGLQVRNQAGLKDPPPAHIPTTAWSAIPNLTEIATPK